MEKNTELEEALITSWVSLTSVLKNNRITQGLNYNEAIIMNIAYHNYTENDEYTSFKTLVQTTKMLKSLVNRTIDSLVEKNLLERCGGEDRRTTFVRPVKDNLEVFLRVHEQSLEIARNIVSIIGERDAETFVEITRRIVEANPLGEKRD